jgi:tyrosinase
LRKPESSKSNHVKRTISEGRTTPLFTTRLWPQHRHSFQFNVPPELVELTSEPLVRKDQAKMSQVERNLFLNTVKALIDNGEYAPLVGIHSDMRHMMHSMNGSIGTLRFLPWHRVYLHEFEQMLIAKAQQEMTFSGDTKEIEIFVPYWDWTVDQVIPEWLKDFTPTVERIPIYNERLGTFVNRKVIVKRDPGKLVDQSTGKPYTLPTQSEVDSANSQTTYTQFTGDVNLGLEHWHNQVHNWVGGTMSNILISPADPIFWLHHANVDRIWATWQKNNSNKNPNLKGKNAVMDPWPDYKEAKTRDTKKDFNYIYE